MTSPRVVCCGEALVDLLPADDLGRAWRAAAGGSPLNAAVAAARLGAPTTFLGVLSEDRFGTLLRAHLDESHVGAGIARADVAREVHAKGLTRPPSGPSGGATTL